MIEGLSKTAKKVTIDEAQNTVQSNGGSFGNGFLKPTTLDLGLDKNVLSGRFSVSPVAPAVDTEGSRRRMIMHGYDSSRSFYVFCIGFVTFVLFKIDVECFSDQPLLVPGKAGRI